MDGEREPMKHSIRMVVSVCKDCYHVARSLAPIASKSEYIRYDYIFNVSRTVATAVLSSLNGQYLTSDFLNIHLERPAAPAPSFKVEVETEFLDFSLMVQVASWLNLETGGCGGKGHKAICS